MSKHIDRNALLMSLSDWQFGSQDDSQLWEALETIIQAIEEMPTIEVSEDAISREELLKHAYKRDGVMSVSVDSIKLAPSVVPSRQQGEWIKKEHGYRCTACNLTNDGESLFCPQCGAKMKGAD